MRSQWLAGLGPDDDDVDSIAIEPGDLDLLTLCIQLANPNHTYTLTLGAETHTVFTIIMVIEHKLNSNNKNIANEL